MEINLFVVEKCYEMCSLESYLNHSERHSAHYIKLSEAHSCGYNSGATLWTGQQAIDLFWPLVLEDSSVVI